MTTLQTNDEVTLRMFLHPFSITFSSSSNGYPRAVTYRNDAMTDDELKTWASKTSSEIVNREGAALALSASDRDESVIEADSNLLGIAMAQAIIEAYRLERISAGLNWDSLAGFDGRHLRH